MAINKSVVLCVLILVCHLALASASNTSQAILCPGDVLTIDCVTMGHGVTVWLGTAFQCANVGDDISLRHSTFGEPYKPKWTCNNGAIVAQAIGVVNDSYISQLNVTASLELNNTTVECLHYSLNITVIKSVQIIVLAKGKQEKVQNCQCIPHYLHPHWPVL